MATYITSHAVSGNTYLLRTISDVDNNGDCMMMVTNTVHDHITSPVALDNTYLFLIISDVRK